MMSPVEGCRSRVSTRTTSPDLRAGSMLLPTTVTSIQLRRRGPGDRVRSRPDQARARPRPRVTSVSADDQGLARRPVAVGGVARAVPTLVVELAAETQEATTLLADEVAIEGVRRLPAHESLHGGSDLAHDGGPFTLGGIGDLVGLRTRSGPR